MRGLFPALQSLQNQLPCGISMFKHSRWKAAGQDSQHSRLPPAQHNKQVSTTSTRRSSAGTKSMLEETANTEEIVSPPVKRTEHCLVILSQVWYNKEKRLKDKAEYLGRLGRWWGMLCRHSKHPVTTCWCLFEDQGYTESMVNTTVLLSIVLPKVPIVMFCLSFWDTRDLKSLPSFFFTFLTTLTILTTGEH